MQNEPVLEIDVDGNKRWLLNNRFHRTDGPAIEYANGNKYWFLNDKKHRTDGPAVELANGNKYWYLNDKEYDFNEWLELTPLPNKEKIKLKFKYAK